MDDFDRILSVIDKKWNASFKKDKPKVLLAMFNEIIYAVVDDTRSVYKIMNSKGQICTVVRSYAVPKDGIYYCENIHIISCPKSEKTMAGIEKFVRESIIPIIVEM